MPVGWWVEICDRERGFLMERPSPSMPGVEEQGRASRLRARQIRQYVGVNQKSVHKTMSRPVSLAAPEGHVEAAKRRLSKQVGQVVDLLVDRTLGCCGGMKRLHGLVDGIFRRASKSGADHFRKQPRGAVAICRTCLYAQDMSKMIQVRDVADHVHGTLKSRAAPR